MQLDDLRPQTGSKRRRRRLCRGIAAGQGASGGKGMRGQKARSGRSTRPGFEGGQMPLYRRVPKLKHFPLVNQKHFTIVNLKQLAGLAAGSEVSLESLKQQGILTTGRHPLKVLGDGECTVALQVEAAAVTRSARAKIEAAGGTVTLTKAGTAAEEVTDEAATAHEEVAEA